MYGNREGGRERGREGTKNHSAPVVFMLKYVKIQCKGLEGNEFPDFLLDKYFFLKLIFLRNRHNGDPHSPFPLLTLLRKGTPLSHPNFTMINWQGV